MRTKLNLFILLFVASFALSGQNTNIDFEATAVGAYTSATGVSGWTVSSQTVSNNCNTSTVWAQGSPEFSIVSTPILFNPYFGNLGNSPLGGTKIAQLNSTTANSSVTKLTTTISVTNSNTLLQYAYAGVWQDGGHACCNQTYHRFTLKDALGIALACYTINAVTPGPSCVSGASNYSVSNNATWTNWQVKFIDLTPHIGTTISFEIEVGDCSFGDHYGMMYFDAKLGNYFTWSGIGINTVFPGNNTVFYCPGSNQAQIIAPPGYYSYSWYAPPGMFPMPPLQTTISTVAVPNPIANSVYTVSMLNPGGCQFIATYTILPSQVGIAGIGANSTCSGGTGGSATVVAMGSGVGYNYSWVNSTNSVISTSSVLANLAPGTYSVLVSAAGNASNTCGTATAAVTVSAMPNPTTTVLKPYCSGEAYLCGPAGSNYQWYAGLTPITPSMGGAMPCYTVVNPANLSFYWISHTNQFGCKDSTKFTLFQQSPGLLSVNNISLVCPGGANATAVVNMTPAAGSLPGYNTFSVTGNQVTTPYTATLGPTSMNQFSLSNLSAGQYTANAFDGSCKYAVTFNVNTFTFNFNLTPGNSPTLCPGQSIAAAISFTSPPAQNQYSYSWTPNQFLAGNIQNLPSTIISPTAAPGTVNTIVYTVVVTPSAMNCPISKTVGISSANPITPTLTPISPLCYGSTFPITINPAGGVFMNNPAIHPQTGIITTSLAGLGVNNFVYTAPGSTCMSIGGTFTVIPNPTITVSGNLNICPGYSTTLLAGGATSYTWNSGPVGPLMVFNSSTTTTYTVVGADGLYNCSSSTVVTVQVLTPPVLVATGNFTICTGETTTLSVTGASTYTWNNNVNGTSQIVSPTSNISYTVTGEGANSCQASKILTVTVGVCAGINKHTSFSFKIYPNPSKGFVSVESPYKTHLTLFDGTGKQVYEKVANEPTTNLDISQLPKGIYFIKSESGGEIRTTKLILE